MKKINLTLIGFSLISLFLLNPAYAVDEWLKAQPAGTAQASDIDTLVASNNASVDRLVIDYRRNCTVVPSAAATFNVLAGEIAIPNAAGTVVRYRRNTSTTAVAWSDIDTGVEESTKQYYVYAVADADATTFTVSISTSSSAPSGKTYYRKIGYFYNNSSGNIVDVGNFSGDSNSVKVVGTTDITLSGVTTPTLMTDMTCNFVSSGRPVLITFSASGGFGGINQYGYVRIYVDGVDKTGKFSVAAATGINYANSTFNGTYQEVLSAGTHTVSIYWDCGDASYTMYQYGSTHGNRILTVSEL